MCGIYAYVGESIDLPNQIYHNLKKLEYRGYDSWGIAVKSDNQLIVQKEIGKLSQCKLRLQAKSNLGIGHTRWATHGGVTEQNAHPHLSCHHDIAVVHNGIIENYLQIKYKLKPKHLFKSETDSEVFAHLVEEKRQKCDLLNAVQQSFLMTKGLSAFVVIDSGSEEIVAVKNGSPLVIGIGKKANYLSSDTGALIDKTDQVIHLEDNQIVYMTSSDIQVFDLKTLKKVKVKINKLDHQLDQVNKNGFDDFMIKEIYDQPKVLDNILVNFDQQISHLATEILKHKKVFLVGCGTAYYAALTAAYGLVQIANIEAYAFSASEFENLVSLVKKDDLVISFSQSGETIDVIQLIKSIKKRKITTIGLVNVFDSTLFRLVDLPIWLQAGAEVSVVSTKAFSAKIAIMLLTAFKIRGQYAQGKKYLYSSLVFLKEQLNDGYYQKHLKPVIKYLAKHQHIFSIGKGMSYPIALECALKIKEVTYQHMEGFASGELKHGVIALIDKGTPVLSLANSDQHFDDQISATRQIKARNGKIIGLSDHKMDTFDFFIPIKNNDAFTTINQTVVAQLIGYHLAKLKKLDPDKPRNLAKSVTVR